ncbi:biopolymer transporter ExbD [Limibacter armeniacum]|uniref:ExbD/TolR family protein n=1 Tax=Limibacter armeniacum TaxID=466084 RepID=UPI002FE549DA
MGLKPENKIDPSFNMSSMTDMIFLLLVFFMLTSNFVTPSGLPITLPTSRPAPPKVVPKVYISITNDNQYFVNEVQVPYEYLEEELKTVLPNTQEGSVVITADKDAPATKVVDVASMAARLKAKVSIAAKPD